MGAALVIFDVTKSLVEAAEREGLLLLTFSEALVHAHLALGTGAECRGSSVCGGGCLHFLADKDQEKGLMTLSRLLPFPLLVRPNLQPWGDATHIHSGSSPRR